MDIVVILASVIIFEIYSMFSEHSSDTGACIYNLISTLNECLVVIMIFTCTYFDNTICLLFIWLLFKKEIKKSIKANFGGQSFSSLEKLF